MIDTQGVDQEGYKRWKRVTPYLYDWITNHNLTWPSLSCRWGPVDEKEEKTFKRKQRLYLSEQTDGSDPNKLVIVNVDVCKPRVASAETLSSFQEINKSPYIKPYKTILHPGEVNKIREFPQYPSVVVTHSDVPELYVWSIEQQPNRATDKNKDSSKANVVLKGHTDNAEFALGLSSREAFVASGGKDKKVCVWNLADSITGLAAAAQEGAAAGEGTTELQAALMLDGHTDTIEDVCFMPGSVSDLASVGDDHQLLLWDTRGGTGPIANVASAHGNADLHTVDWSALRPELLATGAADGTMKVWDKRVLGANKDPLFSFTHHKGALMHVEWCPNKAGILASGAEDRIVAIWDLDRTESAHPKLGLPPQLMFQHKGHRSQVVDFHWNPFDPWTVVSVSDDVIEDELGGGGTLQIWRVTDLLTRDKVDVLEELYKHKDYIITGMDKPAANGVHVDGEVKAEATPLPEGTPAPEGDEAATPAAAVAPPEAMDTGAAAVPVAPEGVPEGVPALTEPVTNAVVQSMNPPADAAAEPGLPQPIEATEPAIAAAAVPVAPELSIDAVMADNMLSSAIPQPQAVSQPHAVLESAAVPVQPDEPMDQA